MATFVVVVPEVHYQTIEVDAATAEEAVKLVLEGEGDQVVGGLAFGYQLEVERLEVHDPDAHTSRYVAIEDLCNAADLNLIPVD